MQILAVRRLKGGGRDPFRAYRVLIDDQEVGRLKRGESARFPLLAGCHDLQVAVDWKRSARFEVSGDGDGTISFRCGPRRSAPARWTYSNAATTLGSSWSQTPPDRPSGHIPNTGAAERDQLEEGGRTWASQEIRRTLAIETAPPTREMTRFDLIWWRTNSLHGGLACGRPSRSSAPSSPQWLSLPGGFVDIRTRSTSSRIGSTRTHLLFRYRTAPRRTPHRLDSTG
jgi:hypothetical protein